MRLKTVIAGGDGVIPFVPNMDKALVSNMDVFTRGTMRRMRVRRVAFADSDGVVCLVF